MALVSSFGGFGVDVGSWEGLGGLLEVNLRTLGHLLGASWSALEAILAQKGNPPDPQSGDDPDRLPPLDSPFRG